MGTLAKTRADVERVAPRATPRCTLGRAWLTLDDEDRAELLGWLRDPSLASVKVAEYLTTAGIRLTDQMVARHRPHYNPGAACMCLVTAEARK